ncbi:MAG TPA: NYN domain-containing protein [Candidatus Bathyarchaeia archaeon]|nr:NYN domain-containing protein [Candidatus Bathyarchaeia archaeon]
MPEEKGMAFIDGANLNRSAEDLGFRIDYKKLKVFLEEWLKEQGYQLIRPYYYTADDRAPQRKKFFDLLEVFGYDVRLVDITKRGTTNIQKGVDVKLAIEILKFGYNKNYDCAILCSGDQDFIPLVHAVKDLGKKVYAAAFNHSCAEEIKRIPDKWFNLTEVVDQIKLEWKIV